MDSFAASQDRFSHLRYEMSGVPEKHGLLLTDNPKLLGGGPVPILQGLSDKERELVLSHGTKKVLNRGQTLFSQGSNHDGIFLISSGRFRVFYTAPSGREITFAYWRPGNFIGGPEIFGTGVHQWTGVATCNASVVHLPGKVLRMLVLQNAALGVALIESLSFKAKCYTALAQMLGTRSVTERLAHLLLHLADVYGVRDSEGVAITEGFTHAEIAHMVGATRQWVTISFKRLQEQGILISRKSEIVVCRFDKLAEMRDGK